MATTKEYLFIISRNCGNSITPIKFRGIFKDDWRSAFSELYKHVEGAIAHDLFSSAIAHKDVDTVVGYFYQISGETVLCFGETTGAIIDIVNVVDI